MIPMMPLTTFHPLRYKQLIDIATGTNNLPDVVGQIRMFQGNDLRGQQRRSELANLYIFTQFLQVKNGLLAQFRDLHSMTIMKYKVVIITSINPRVFKGNNYQLF
ncbi:unnamed protein product [Brassica rapa]|uniref:Uncharacterized protein n=2 Tax=Brassica TaxID=3705 RepID=A0A8D9HWW2_BRACM|nr:unnamed protein product [Brassica napus]CAG7906474.1 unnamed protein product [Brassica rapa]